MRKPITAESLAKSRPHVHKAVDVNVIESRGDITRRVERIAALFQAT